MRKMRNAALATVGALVIAGAAAGSASALTASTYTFSTSYPQSYLSATLSGTAVFYSGPITVKCNTSSGVAGIYPKTGPLSAIFGLITTPTFSDCSASISGLARPASVSTAPKWTLSLFKDPAYRGTINVPDGGATVVVGTGATACTITVQKSSVASTGRGASGTLPTTLGTPVTRLYVNGTVNVSVSGSPCPAVTTATFKADGTTVNGTKTGYYVLSGSLTEN